MPADGSTMMPLLAVAESLVEALLWLLAVGLVVGCSVVVTGLLLRLMRRRQRARPDDPATG